MMNLLRLISGRNASAPVARERLQILLAHERGLRGQPELLELLRAEILAAVSRHVVLDLEKVVVKMDRGKQVSTLEVDIEVPNGFFGSSRPFDDVARQEFRPKFLNWLKKYEKSGKLETVGRLRSTAEQSFDPFGFTNR
jgi:cell division topological specificity factor